jgi:hypothetical protein
MRILIAGSNEVWSLEKIYKRYLERAGAAVDLVPVQSIFYQYYNRSILHKIIFKAGLSRIGHKIEGILKDRILEWRPDVIWVFKGMEISPGLLAWARQKGVRLVNYNPDNPFIFSGRGSGNNNVTRSISLYDLHFTYDRKVRQRIVEEFQLPCPILPFGFELSTELYEECRRQKEVVKLCFLGNPDEQRAAFLLRLAGEFAIDVYGVDWNKYIRHSNVTVYPPVYGDEFWRTLYKYRVQLNLMRQHNPDSHNMRSFEVPGAGAIGLFPYTPDHAQFFVEQKEVFLYKNMEECRRYAGLLLNMTQEDADRIRIAARRKSLEAGYTYSDRASQVLQEMEKLMV